MFVFNKLILPKTNIITKPTTKPIDCLIGNDIQPSEYWVELLVINPIDITEIILNSNIGIKIF